MSLLPSLSADNATCVVLDALPYVDVVHEDYESYALALVEQEMKEMKPPAAVSKEPPTTRSTILEIEFEFVASGKERASIIHASELSIPKSENADEWKECIGKARAAYEAERIRGAVLELEGTHAPNQWKQYTSSVLESLEQQESLLHKNQQSLLEEVHAQRQEEQVEASKTLSRLEQKYQDLIHKRHYLQMATLELEGEVNRMKKEVATGE